MPFKGETICDGFLKSGAPCTKKAYYETTDGHLRCGTHSNSDTRTELPTNANQKQDRERAIALHRETIKPAGGLNSGVPGVFVLAKMKMFGTPELIPGFMNIFPNYKHGSRKDGIGMPSLSPKSMGPVVHGQPGLPDALSIENFHQGNKVFPSEIDSTGAVLPSFYETQIAMYSDPEPHRHKEAAKSASGANKNVPAFSMWKAKDGVEHRLSYFESRQFYCTFYERFAINNADFKLLAQKIKSGYNVCICGYDAYPMPDLSASAFHAAYKDVSKPFGHELVLAAMLALKPEEYPWKQHVTFDF